MSNSSFHKDHLPFDEEQRITGLITGYVSQSLTAQEQDELEEWISASDKNRLLFEELTDQARVEQDLAWFDKSDAAGRLKKLKKQLHFTDGNTRSSSRTIGAYAIAASFILMIALTFYLVRPQTKTDAGSAPLAAIDPQDVQPGGDKAVLTLADGSRIILDQAGDGRLATQGGGEVVKQNGQLRYTISSDPLQVEAMQNTVTTPRGGSYSLTLSDGTRLWLNAASSIRFPAVFTGQERRVAITGEVYFEVAKDAQKPFRVEVADKGMQIEVLGTHFNVSSYADEAQARTTLLEGAVKVVTDGNELLLKPGQQARLDKTGSLTRIDHADTDQAIAWKNGLFQFVNADMQTLMGQLSRWYDIDISYDGPVPDILTTGKAPRNISLANLLKIISLSGIHYKIEGKKLLILP